MLASSTAAETKVELGCMPTAHLIEASPDSLLSVPLITHFTSYLSARADPLLNPGLGLQGCCPPEEKYYQNST